jgi:hypothetical protein
MHVANILLSLGGDHGNTVSKFGCTAAEIAVLREIHGNDAVKDIEPAGSIKRGHREERIRLLNIYGAAKTEDQKPIVESMFPGVAARVFETLDELGIDESFFKASGRLTANPAPALPVVAPGARAKLLPAPPIAVWVDAGYPASAYPPAGFEATSSPEEIAAAVAAENTSAEADDEDDGVGEDIDDGIGGDDILG